MTQHDDVGPGLIQKPRGFLTNASEIAHILQKRCSGGHRHIPLLGGRARLAQVYPPALCRAILEGLKALMYHDGRLSFENTGTVIPADAPEGNLLQLYSDELPARWDDVSGLPLDPTMVAQARAEELIGVHWHNVYEEVPADSNSMG